MECETCTECCTSLPIDDIDIIKEAGKKCKYCALGCTIYTSRPESCINFNCTYDNTDINLRPDKTHVIFERLTTKIHLALVHQNYLNTWKSPTLKKYIKQLNSAGISIVVSSFKTGILEIHTAENHEENKVRAIVIGLVN